MGRGLWAVGFNLYAARHYVVIGAMAPSAARGFAAFGGGAPKAPIRNKEL